MNARPRKHLKVPAVDASMEELNQELAKAKEELARIQESLQKLESEKASDCPNPEIPTSRFSTETSSYASALKRGEHSFDSRSEYKKSAFFATTTAIRSEPKPTYASVIQTGKKSTLRIFSKPFSPLSSTLSDDRKREAKEKTVARQPQTTVTVSVKPRLNYTRKS